MNGKKKFLSSFICIGLLTTALPVYAADLPSYFDWRRSTPTDRTSAETDAVVGPARDQGHYQDCWSFATNASLESSINLQRQAVGLGPIPRLSERYLSWLTFAKPLDGTGDGFYYGTVDPSKTKEVYDVGDFIYQPVSTLVRYGVAYNSQAGYDFIVPATDEGMAGVTALSGNGVALHDYFGMEAVKDGRDKELFVIDSVNNKKDYYKTMLQKYGIIRVNFYSAEVDGNNPNICNTVDHSMDHAVTLVGWDDDYVMATSDGVRHKGAWLLRNSWGTGAGTDGYFYLSYDDVTTSYATFYNAETDWGRYTAVNSVAPGSFNIGANNDNANDTLPWPITQVGGYKTASKLTSSASQILKAVGIFVPADSMTYTVDVSLKGDTPANTQTIYTKTGTFGQDGTAIYKGYRTIDFDKYVYLPNGQNYIVTVTLKGQDGTTYVIPIEQEDDKPLTPGTSFVYDPKAGAWVDVQQIDLGVGSPHYSNRNTGIPLFALNKYSKEANGGDFTVVSLNDNGVGGSEIYLGKKDELYTTDLLHPALPDYPNSYRYTLSNMTVELTKDLTDSVYGGVISGEGQVIKTGTGMLALSGANTYTGATNVKEGSFALTGSLTSPVTVASGATFTGYGTINGNLTNSGAVQPGLTAQARNLFYAASGSSTTTTDPQVGTLTVNGNFTSNGKLIIATNGTNSGKLVVGGSSTLTGTALNVVNGGTNPLVNHTYNYLTSQGGITGNVTTTDLSPYVSLSATVDGNNGYFTANEKKGLGQLSNLTPSEQSVGAALNKMAVQSVAANPNAATTAVLNSTLYQSEAVSRTFTKQITSEARAELLNQSPMSALTNESIFSRMETVDWGGAMPVNAAQSLDANAPQMKTSIPVALDATNNVWFKLFRGFENYNYNDSLENKSFGGVVGYDHAINLTTRIGGLFSYGVTDYNTDNIEGKSYDWRIGVYGDHKNGDWDYQALATYGRNHYDLDRSVTWEGTKTNSDYKAKVWDGEVKAKYFIPSTQNKTWQVKPYGKLSYTHTAQDAYAETGSSTFKQSLNSTSNNSWRGELGVELNRNLNNKTSWGGSIGYKRILSGLNPELNGTFVGDTNGFSITSDNDRNYVTYSLNARGSLGGKWMGLAEFRGEASSNTHKEVLSVTAKYSF